MRSSNKRWEDTCSKTSSYTNKSDENNQGRWKKDTVCSYHVTHVFQSDPTLCSCLNVKELLAQNRTDNWSLSDCNEIRTHNGWIRKRALSHLGNLAMVWLNDWVFIYKVSGCGFESCCGHLIKNKVRILKNSQKIKENNRKTLTLSNFPQYFHEIDEVIRFRKVQQ